MRAIIIFLILSFTILFSQEILAIKLISNDSVITEQPIDANQNIINNIKVEKFLNDENSTTIDWLTIATLLALIATVIISIFTYKVASNNLVLTHRPFVWVDNFGYTDENGDLKTPINEVMIITINSPARFDKEYFEYYIIDNLNNKTTIEIQEYSGKIRYPHNKSQLTNTASLLTDEKVEKLNDNQKLERFIRIDYSWLSSKKKYYFESKWRLDKNSKKWKVISQTAD